MMFFCLSQTSEFRLITLKQMSTGQGTILLGLFDLYSVILIFVSLAILTFILVVRSDMIDITVLGMYYDQSVGYKRKSLALATAIFGSTMFGLMYKTLLISHLTKPDPGKPLDSLEQLLDMEPSFKAWVWAPSYIEDFLRLNYKTLVDKDRIIFGDDPWDPFIMQGFFSGRLAFLDSMDSVKSIFLNPMINQGLRCSVKEDNLYSSKASYSSGFMGPISSKSYRYKEEVTKALMRMDAAGFNSNIHDFHWQRSNFLSRTIAKDHCDKNILLEPLLDCFQQEATVTMLKLSHFSRLIAVCFIGFSVSFATFLLEIMSKSWFGSSFRLDKFNMF